MPRRSRRSRRRIRVPGSCRDRSGEGMNTRSRWIAAAVLFTAASLARAGNFTAGNVVVYRVGDGTTALSTAAAPAFVDEYLPATASQLTTVQSLALPTSTAGSNKRLTAAGSQAEGFLTRSA